MASWATVMATVANMNSNVTVNSDMNSNNTVNSDHAALVAAPRALPEVHLLPGVSDA